MTQLSIVPSRLWTPPPLSLLFVYLRLLLPTSLWYLSMSTYAHTIEFPSVPGSFLVFMGTSARFKWPNRPCHFLALSNRTLLELILNSQKLQGTFFLKLIFLAEQFFGISYSLGLSPKWSFSQLFAFRDWQEVRTIVKNK